LQVPLFVVNFSSSSSIDARVSTTITNSASHLKWPSVRDINEYKEKVRNVVLEAIVPLTERSNELFAQRGRVFRMVAEHDLMVRYFFQKSHY